MKPEIATALDRVYGPVVATFTVIGVPPGGAPHEIRKDWLQAQLPLRALHAQRLYLGYIGRRFHPLAEDRAVDALTGENPKWPVWGNVEIRGYDAIESLRAAGKVAAAEFWAPYEEAMLGFDMADGHFGSGFVNTEQ